MEKIKGVNLGNWLVLLGSLDRNYQKAVADLEQNKWRKGSF